MQDAATVGMLDRPAQAQHQREPFRDGELVPVAVLGHGEPRHQFHREEGSAVGGGARVEHPRQAVVVEARGGLHLAGEAPQGIGTEPTLMDHLDRHPALDRFALQRFVDGAHAARPENPQHLVVLDLRQGGLWSGTGEFRDRVVAEEVEGMSAVPRAAGASGGLVGGGRRIACSVGVVVGVRVDERGRSLGAEIRTRLLEQRTVAVTRRLERLQPPLRLGLQRRIESLLDPLPSFLVGDHQATILLRSCRVRGA